jgi:hypothetical protein
MLLMVSFSARLGKLSFGLGMRFTRVLDVGHNPADWRASTMELTAISAQLEKCENKWVAIDESEEKIVGVGDDAFEATEDAQRHGYQETILFKVPSFDVALSHSHDFVALPPRLTPTPVIQKWITELPRASTIR